MQDYVEKLEIGKSQNRSSSPDISKMNIQCSFYNIVYSLYTC